MICLPALLCLIVEKEADSLWERESVVLSFSVYWSIRWGYSIHLLFKRFKQSYDCINYICLKGEPSSVSCRLTFQLHIKHFYKINNSSLIHLKKFHLIFDREFLSSSISIYEIFSVDIFRPINSTVKRICGFSGFHSIFEKQKKN